MFKLWFKGVGQPFKRSKRHSEAYPCCEVCEKHAAERNYKFPMFALEVRPSHRWRRLAERNPIGVRRYYSPGRLGPGKSSDFPLTEVGELSKSFLVANISSRLGDSSEPKPTSAACELGNTEKTQAARNLNRCSMKKGGSLMKKPLPSSLRNSMQRCNCA